MHARPSNAHQQHLFDVETISIKSKQKKKTEGSYVFDIVDALSAPVLTYSYQWSEMIPKRMIDIVPLARMTALMREEQLATYAECVIYIYTRTLEAPMDSEWTDIYTHISCKTLEEWFGENHWKATGAPIKLNEWLLSKLTKLRCHIYNKRRDILKSQFKVQENMKKEMSEKNKEVKTTQQQKTLFI